MQADLNNAHAGLLLGDQKFRADLLYRGKSR